MTFRAFTHSISFVLLKLLYSHYEHCFLKLILIVRNNLQYESASFSNKHIFFYVSYRFIRKIRAEIPLCLGFGNLDVLNEIRLNN